jgi:2-methylcitrate dehydratase PrpD
MADEGLVRLLGRFAAQTTFDQLPDSVVDSVRMRVLDIVGICVAAGPLETSAAARAFAAEQSGQGPLPATWAAFVNGVLAHSLDYDDTHLPSVLHPSASVVPAALASASSRSGCDLIAAIAVGLEVCVRTGMAGYDATTQTSLFFEHGQHATSICGTLGAAAAAGKLLGLDASRLADAVGIAASMGSGIIEANRTGGTVKRLHCGWAAHAGVAAAQLAARGFTAPPTALEGRFGFYQAWLHGRYDAGAITEGLGQQWTVPDIFFKPYPANHFTHAAIDAAIELRRRGVRPSQVREATLGVAAATVRTIGEPIEVKRAPETGYMAQFSGPYAVAAGLFGGAGLGVGLDDFTDELTREPARRELMAKVSVVADERCTRLFPYQFPAVLRVRLHDGRELTAEVLANRGGPDHPLSYEELTTKFRDNTERLLPATVVADLAERIASLDRISDAGELLRSLPCSTC